MTAIKLDKDGDLWTVILNRPKKANALTKRMLVNILEVVEQAASQASVLVITGEGDVFSAGADLDEVGAGLATDRVWEDLSMAISAMPCLTIAALNGTVAGGAFGMILACDIRISVQTANFFYPVMKLGILPQPSDPSRLADLLGPARAKMILLAGQKISAGTAFDWGLVNKVVDQGMMSKVIREVASDALVADREHLGSIKSMF